MPDTMREPFDDDDGERPSGTAHESFVAGHGDSVNGVTLLSCLSGRFSLVGGIALGGQADVLLVSDDADRRWVVKQYRSREWEPDAEVLETLMALREGRDRENWQDEDPFRHLVWLQEWGRDPSSQKLFEVQEYLAAGPLAGGQEGVRWSRLQEWTPGELAGALVDAVSAFHQVVEAHRDLKPENLLLRSADPLVLAIGDTGVSRRLGNDEARRTKVAGSPAYQAPEASRGKVTQGGDWWSVGMMIAEAALGRHPLELPDGSLPAPAVLLDPIIERDIPLDGIADLRLRLLCQGLLTRDPELRWESGQIEVWREGGSPAVHFGLAGPHIARDRVRRVLFAGHFYESPAELARAFTDNPDVAGSLLFEQRDQVLLSQLRAMLRANGLSEAQAELDGFRSGSWRAVLLRLVAEMDRGLRPSLFGLSATPEGVAAMAQRVIKAGEASEDQRRVLEWITEDDVWRWWMDLPGMGGAPEAAERLFVPPARFPASGDLVLVGDRPEWEVNARGLSPLLYRTTVERFWTSARPSVAAWSCVLAVHPTEAVSALDQCLREAAPGLESQDWWRGWAEGNGPADSRVFAACAIPLARVAAGELPGRIDARDRQRRQGDRRLEWLNRRENLDSEVRMLAENQKPRLVRWVKNARFVQKWGLWGCAVWYLVFLVAYSAVVAVVGINVLIVQTIWAMSGEDATLSALGVILVLGAYVAAGIAIGRRVSRKRASRLGRQRELEAQLQQPPPWEDPGMQWSDRAGDWVPKP